MRQLNFINQITAFLLELIMLAVIGRWAFLQGGTTWLQYSLSAVAILVIIVLWGYFAAPRSAHRLDIFYRVVFKLALFTITTVLLHRLGYTSYAIAFAAVAVLCVALEYYFKDK